MLPYIIIQCYQKDKLSIIELSLLIVKPFSLYIVISKKEIHSIKMKIKFILQLFKIRQQNCDCISYGYVFLLCE